MSPIDFPDATTSDPLADLPLRNDGAPETLELALSGAADPLAREPFPAKLSARAIAFAADVAGTSLSVTLALIAAVALAGRAPRLSGLPWATGFGLGFSFFFVVLPLTLFGRTVGMSLAGLAARPGATGRRLTPSEASRRWLGTALSALGLGIPLLFTFRDPVRPTPADRLSDRPLIRDIER